MPSKQTMFFAIEDDLHSILQAVEHNFEIEYVVIGSFESDEVVSYSSFSDIPKLGFTSNGDWAGLDHRYMIVSKGSAVDVRKVEQRKGGIRYLIDSIKNPDSVEFTPKGIYTKRNNVIVAGRTAIVSEHQFANALYKSLASKIKNRFKRIGAFHVGPRAEEKLKVGWRLVQIESSPREYDLAYPS